MEFDYYSPSETFVLLTADQFVGRDDGLLEQQKQNNHITVDITYYFGSLLVFGGFCEFKFQKLFLNHVNPRMNKDIKRTRPCVL